MVNCACVPYIEFVYYFSVPYIKFGNIIFSVPYELFFEYYILNLLIWNILTELLLGTVCWIWLIFFLNQNTSKIKTNLIKIKTCKDCHLFIYVMFFYLVPIPIRLTSCCLHAPFYSIQSIILDKTFDKLCKLASTPMFITGALCPLG